MPDSKYQQATGFNLYISPQSGISIQVYIALNYMPDNLI